jgi:uncharacterized membrane protein YjdF
LGPLAGSCANRPAELAEIIATTIQKAARLLLPTRRFEHGAARDAAPRRTRMLETIAVILIVLWLLGMVSGYTLGNFIYVLLVIAIVLFLVRLISGRRV